MAKFRARSDVPDEVLESNPGSTYLMWPNAKRGPWLARVQWTRIDGRLEVVGLELKSFRETDQDWPAELPSWRATPGWGEKGEQGRPPAILTATTLRAFPFGAVVSDLRDEAYRANLAFAGSLADMGDGLNELLVSQAERDRGARRRGMAPMEDVAKVYQRHEGSGGQPTKAVAEHFKIAHSTAAKWVMRARKEGHLPAARKAAKKSTGGKR